jgi:hypothetical protein
MEEQIKMLDSSALKYVRQDLGMLKSFPTAPLFHHDFIGSPTHSELYYEARLANMWWNLGKRGKQAEKMSNHIERAMQRARRDPMVEKTILITQGPTQQLPHIWMTGLLVGVERAEL